MAPDDRVFLAGILKRLRESCLEIPVLPRAAIEIARLVANPNTQMSEYVRVLTADPSLSVEVLRMANSAYYGFTNPTRSVRDAVVRLGLNQIRGLLVVAHLKSKVLQGGVFHREAGWLSDLSLALAHLGRQLASDLGLEPDAAFTRGLLMHVEHFVVLGAVADVSRDHRRRIYPTREGLAEAFHRFGSRVRTLTARGWDLQELLDPPGEQGSTGALYEMLRRALVERWTGGESGEVPGLPEARLEDALSRVDRKDDTEPASEAPVSSAHP